MLKVLDKYLDSILPKPDINKKKYNICCYNKNNIILSTNLLLFVCCKCGMVMWDTPNNKDFYEPNKNPLIVKTFIPYSRKHYNLYRLNKWNNYIHAEVSLNKLLISIDIKLKDFDKEVTSFTKILFKQIYQTIRIRAKIKDALIVYCLYKSHLLLNKPVDIDNLIKLLNISIKNYNDLNKKLTFDKLYYFNNINKFINIIQNNIDIGKYKIDKNQIIQIFNTFLNHNKLKYNNKTIVLGILHFLLQNNIKNFKSEEFFKSFDISKNSIKSINVFIKENNIK